MAAVLLDRRTPVARREHICHNCGEIIEPGQRYERQAIAYDGTAWTYKSHERCHDISMAFARYYALGEDEMPSADVWSEVLDWWESRDEIRRLDGRAE